MESDLKRSRNSSIVCIFQSTLPAWGATAALTSTKSSSQNFNPRSPRGERQPYLVSCLEFVVFQSTLPAWGATIV